jgi:DTW domain-containing protein YfiP
MAAPLGKRKRKVRCEGCGLWPELCACDLFPSVEVQTPILVVRHYKERFKPTSTAKLLPAMASNVQLLDYTGGMPPFDPTPLRDEALDLRVLFPREDAEPMRQTDDGTGGLTVAEGKRLGFVILDGTWHQCSRMSRRVPGVAELPCVSLPESEPSIYRVRSQHDERGLCTFEAVVRLWEVLEGPEVVRPLRAVFEVITARMLYQKGWLDSPEVPADWNDVEPKG